jgi:hypothetical protein
MGLKDCLISAVEQKAISREEATFLADEFEERFAQNRLSMGDDVAKAKARKDLEATLRAEAIEKKRRADLTEARRLGIKSYLQGYRDRDGRANVYEGAMALLSHYGYRGTSSVRGKTEAIIAGAHKNLDQVMFTFQRKGLFGQRQNRAMVSDVVRELHGEASGDATAKGLARSITAVFEDLRQRFNAAGGAIGKLENFGLPHSHDRMKVKAQGHEAWKAAIRPLLDADRMTNPLTGNPVGASGVNAALDHVYASIVSNNRAHITPAMGKRGAGSIATQRQDERFLVFRDAASWEAYNRQFGRGDVIQAVFNHVNGMARDIASMEMLGPNPASMVEYLKQVTEHEIGKGEAGLASLVPESKMFPGSQAKLASYRIDSLWQTIRGRPQVVDGAAGVTASIKNLMTSAQLGSTAILAASTDPFVSASARRLAGLPVTSTMGKMVDTFRAAKREEIVRAGVIWDEYMHVMHDELRFAGPAVGAEWSRWLADRTVAWSGLAPLTTGRKLVEARAWQGHIADMADRSFDKLDPRFRTTLEGFDVTPAEWDIWRNSVDPMGFVTPRQIEENGGAVTYLDMKAGALSSPAHQAEAKALAHRDAAEKLSELVTSWSERSVPGGTPNARSVVTGFAPRGTIGGELLDYMLQYKSFGLSFTALQLEAIGEMAAARGGGKGWRTGAAYFAAMAVPITLGGGTYMQIKSMLDGKEPADMRDPSFWIKATFQGGGFGLFGDFVKSSESRFGQTPIEALAGPGVAFIGDVAGLTAGNAQKLIGGEKMTPGRDLRRFAGRYTPIIASHWATRGAYNRLFLDNLQWLTDPEADKAFKRQASKAAKDGQAFFVKPGQFTPAW